MFTELEIEYLRALVSTYYEHGYKYYLAYTVTDRNDTTDIVVFFSKTSIKALSNTSYNAQHAIQLKIDSSSKSEYSFNERVVYLNNDYSGIVNIDVAEFCFTNAELDYKTETFFVNPDIHYVSDNGVYDMQLNVVAIFVAVISFIYLFIAHILRVRG